MAHNNERKTPPEIVADPTPKRRKIQIQEWMENIIIPDDVLLNILSRLSAKPLMRSRCVCKHWNSLITDPYFINSRSRRMILICSLLVNLHLHALDDKHPNLVKFTTPLKFARPRPFKPEMYYRCNAIGTLNGIVLLVFEKMDFGDPLTFILYNPLTRAAKKLPDPPHDPHCGLPVALFAYGFGHGKIIAARSDCICTSNNISYCNVFNLKKGSWTTPKTTFRRINFVDDVGVFLNGFLHWISLRDGVFRIAALDVKEMVATWMDAPPLSSDYYDLQKSVLGTLHGCLYMISKWGNGFDVWMMMTKEWSKQYSFALPFYRCGYEESALSVCILGDGRVVVGDDVSNQIIICHLSERYYDIFKCTSKIPPFANGIEYVESLVSLSDICHV